MVTVAPEKGAIMAGRNGPRSGYAMNRTAGDSNRTVFRGDLFVAPVFGSLVRVTDNSRLLLPYGPPVSGGLTLSRAYWFHDSASNAIFDGEAFQPTAERTRSALCHTRRDPTAGARVALRQPSLLRAAKQAF